MKVLVTALGPVPEPVGTVTRGVVGTTCVPIGDAGTQRRNHGEEPTPMPKQQKMSGLDLLAETITLEEYRRHLDVPAVHFVRPGSEKAKERP